MPMYINLHFTCDTAKWCTSNGGSPGTAKIQVLIAPDLIDLQRGLKELPDGWDRRGEGERLRCPSCVKGPPNLNTAG